MESSHVNRALVILLCFWIFYGLLREAIGVVLSILLFLDSQNSERFFRERERERKRKGEEAQCHRSRLWAVAPTVYYDCRAPRFLPTPVSTHISSQAFFSLPLGQGDFMGVGLGFTERFQEGM